MTVRGRVVLVAIAAGLLAPGRASAQATTAPTGTEVHTSHGRTWIDFPYPLFQARMDRDGKVTASATAIGVAHQDATPGCTAALGVRAITGVAASDRVVLFPTPRCSFGADAAALALGTDSAARMAKKVCEDSLSYARNTIPVCRGVDSFGRPQCGPAPDPLFLGPSKKGPSWRREKGFSAVLPFGGAIDVKILYANGSEDAVAHVPGPGVQLTCDAVPCVTRVETGFPNAAAGRPYRALVFSGLKPPLRFDSLQVPPGLSVGPDGYLSGVPSRPGDYHVVVHLVDNSACVWNPGSRWWDEFMLTVRDLDGPTIAGFTTSPDTLPYAGGDVTTTVQASDNVGVAKVVSSRTLPDGTGNSGILQRVSGSDADGIWKMTWSLPANGAKDPVAYIIKAWALDAANNETRAAAGRTVVVRGHPSGQERIQLTPKP